MIPVTSPLHVARRTNIKKICVPGLDGSTFAIMQTLEMHMDKYDAKALD